MKNCNNFDGKVVATLLGNHIFALWSLLLSYACLLNAITSKCLTMDGKLYMNTYGKPWWFFRLEIVFPLYEPPRDRKSDSAVYENWNMMVTSKWLTREGKLFLSSDRKPWSTFWLSILRFLCTKPLSGWNRIIKWNVHKIVEFCSFTQKWKSWCRVAHIENSRCRMTR